MYTRTRRTIGLLVVAAWPLLMADVAGASEEGDAVREQLEAHLLTEPKYDQSRRGDPEYAAVYRAESSLFMVRKVKLIGDLWRAEPGAPELPELMPYRWQYSNRISGLEIDAEIEAFAEQHPAATAAVADGWFYFAINTISRNSRDSEKALAAAEAFIQRYPDDERGSDVLYAAGRRLAAEDPQKTDLNRRIVRQYPDSRYGKRIAAEIRRDAAVGEPFEMTFTDHITGNVISMEDLRGQVVVIDFWAVWCGPCKASLPHLKELYARYHDSGMEIIGVSLDSDPQVMIDFCRENDMTWPQYCEEGKVWDTEFSTGWGISAIPSMFIVDRKGILRDVKARGRLDDLVPELLGEPGP